MAEDKIQIFLREELDKVSIDQIEDAITADNLCDCENPITSAFEVSASLHPTQRSRKLTEVHIEKKFQ